MSLRADHDASEALAALSLPNECTPGGLSRRRFLAGLGAAGAVATFGASALRPKAAWGADGPHNLVVVYLGGGNDGFATVMPRGASPLDQLRPALLSVKSQLLPIDADYGFHPVLPTLHRKFTEGQVALVGGVGRPGTLSHFDAIKDWMVGSPNAASGPNAGSGWLGRWLDALGPADDVPLRATSITGSVPQLLLGRTTAGIGLGLRASSLLGATRRSPIDLGLFQTIEGWGDSVDPTTARGRAAANGATASQLAGSLGSVYLPALPSPDSQAKGILAARLLNNPNYGCRTVYTDVGSFDHHADLLNGQASTLTQFDQILKYFWDTLDAGVAQRTTVLAFSEFGRRPLANGSAGADHGTASYAFAIGPPVKGGVYGSYLNPAQLDGAGNPPTTVPHLDLIGSVLGGWLDADADAIIGTTTNDLGLFN